MNDLYSALAQKIVAHCPAAYEKATLTAEVEEDWSNFSLVCHLPNGAESMPRIGGLSASEIDDTLVEIRGRMLAQQGSSSWSRCTFVFHPDGRFKFDVEYDD